MFKHAPCNCGLRSLVGHGGRSLQCPVHEAGGRLDASPTLRLTISVAKVEVAQAAPLVIERPALRAEVPIDCEMVRSVDPRFQSNMPVVKPDPTIDYTMHVVKAPACPAVGAAMTPASAHWLLEQSPTQMLQTPGPSSPTAP